jgi:predicted transcriptional regulator
MTVRLSPQKVSRMLRLFFSGMPQTDIAEKAGVDQSTVSIYASRFRRRADDIGLLAAGKEFSVLNEVSALRSLSVELTQANLTVEDAKKGLRIFKIFIGLGIEPGQHAALVKVCKDIDDPGFIQAAVKLSRVEAEVKMTYEEATSRFENAISALSSTEGKLKMAQAELEALNNRIAQRKQEAVSLEAHVAQLQKEADNRSIKLGKEFEVKKKQLEVKQAEIEEIAALKKKLGKNSLDIQTLVKLAKEFGYGSEES